ncbi:MAG TPA: PQQ-binding-like beta-propeller repeat protein [Pirellulaceae bacterium]|jgi:outer membrane protein assembly factor BamB|nr:PQQ-binding-like beta-propeller repeat protein [Pirellulaceae bacterium]
MIRYIDFAAPRRRSLTVALFLLASLGFGLKQGRAGDWPQILGPDRSGAATGESLFAEGNIPWDGQASGASGAAKPLWSAKVGAGYAGPIATRGVAYLLHRQQDENLLTAFDLQKGSRLWEVSFPASYQGGIDPDEGPRATPVAVDDPADPQRKLIVCFTAEADLHVVRTPAASDERTAEGARGTIVWSRKLGEEYRIFDSYFGAGSSPIVVGNRILVNLGGRDGAGIVALDLATGKTLWKATDEQASYSSPIAAKVGTRDAVVFVTRLNLLGIDPAKGDVLFTTRFGQTGPTVNAATPTLVGKNVFVTASYNLGCRMVDVSGADVLSEGPQDVWASERMLSSQYATPLLGPGLEKVGGYLYGCDGREDQGAIDLVCLRASDGKEMWRVSGEGMTHLIRVGDSALGLNVDGTLTQFPLNPSAFNPIAKGKLTKPSCRALPALSEGVFLARQTDDAGGSLVALRVGPSAEKSPR